MKYRFISVLRKKKGKLKRSWHENPLLAMGLLAILSFYERESVLALSVARDKLNSI